jgi:hypothetical protein
MELPKKKVVFEQNNDESTNIIKIPSSCSVLFEQSGETNLFVSFEG